MFQVQSFELSRHMTPICEKGWNLTGPMHQNNQCGCADLESLCMQHRFQCTHLSKTNSRSLRPDTDHELSTTALVDPATCARYIGISDALGRRSQFYCVICMWIEAQQTRRWGGLKQMDCTAFSLMRVVMKSTDLI